MILTSEDTLKVLNECIDSLGEPHASILKDFIDAGLKMSTEMRTKYKMQASYRRGGIKIDPLENLVNEAFERLKEALLDRGLNSVKHLPEFV